MQPPRPCPKGALDSKVPALKAAAEAEVSLAQFYLSPCLQRHHTRECANQLADFSNDLFNTTGRLPFFIRQSADDNACVSLVLLGPRIERLEQNYESLRLFDAPALPHSPFFPIGSLNTMNGCLLVMLVTLSLLVNLVFSTKDAKANSSKADNSKTDNSNADDSETDDSETDDSETDDFEADDSEAAKKKSPSRDSDIATPKEQDEEAQVESKDSTSDIEEQTQRDEEQQAKAQLNPTAQTAPSGLCTPTADDTPQPPQTNEPAPAQDYPHEQQERELHASLRRLAAFRHRCEQLQAMRREELQQELRREELQQREETELRLQLRWLEEERRRERERAGEGGVGGRRGENARCEGEGDSSADEDWDRVSEAPARERVSEALSWETVSDEGSA